MLAQYCSLFCKKNCSKHFFARPKDNSSKISHISCFPELSNVHSIPVPFLQRRFDRKYFNEHDLHVSCIPTIIPQMKQITMRIIQHLDIVHYEQATDEIILEFLEEL